MSKGYSSQTKLDRLTAEFTTNEPVRREQNGSSVVAHQYVYIVGTDAVEAGSTVEEVVATAHAAKKGDVIRFTSGALDGTEVKVWETSTNAIIFAEDLESAPAAAVTFQILRHKYPVVGSDGKTVVTATQGPVIFTLNGVDQEVTEDTVTPANNAPLPVKLTSVTGDINITAGDLNVNMSAFGATYDSCRIGDGTNLLGITAAGEAKVSLTTALPAGTNNIGDVDVLSLPSIPAGTNNIGDVDVLSLPAITAVDLDIRDLSSAQDSVAAVQSGTWNVTNISGTVSLPTGAATSAAQTTGNASLSSIDGKLNSLGQKAMAASVPVVLASDQSAIPVSATNLDIRDLTSASDSVAAVQSGTWNINNIAGTVSLPTGAATESTLSTLNGKIPSGLTVTSTRLLVDGSGVIQPVSGTVSVNQNYLDVVDFLDTPLLVASSTNIPASASTPLTVVASLAAAVKKVQFLDTTGSFIGLYSDPAGTPVLQAIFGPGSDQTIELALPAATVLGLRNMENSAISAGNVSINFIG